MTNKKLHFYPKLASLILSGKKRKTWRLWDDKNLSEGDVVDCLETGTERKFATIRLVGVVEKKMKELTEQDKDGHEKFESDKEMYETYSRYYGKQVDSETRVKIVDFELL